MTGNDYYTVAVQREFIAQHFLFGGDWGEENNLHSHHYRVEIQLEGSDLDEHGYLVDIVDIETRLEHLVSYFREKTLNDLPELEDLNPSIEHLSRLFCDAMAEDMKAPNLTAVTAIIWENEIAWASFRREIP